VAESVVGNAFASSIVSPMRLQIVVFPMRPWLLSLLPSLWLSISVIPASAQERVYSYSVVHPYYGTIGTFTERIARSGDTTRIESHVRVAVKIFGIVVHREEGDHVEIFRSDRLISLQSATTTNGARLEVRGEAKGEYFVVTSPTGVVEAPSDVAPSDPWVLKQIGVGTVVSVKTGRIIPTRVSGGEPAMLPLQGAMVPTRHFTARGEREQEIWLNDQDVPVMFRSVENGTSIDFILTSPWRDAAVAEAHLVPAAKLHPAKE
jgi:hypothetical protein